MSRVVVIQADGMCEVGTNARAVRLDLGAASTSGDVNLFPLQGTALPPPTARAERERLLGEVVRVLCHGNGVEVRGAAIRAFRTEEGRSGEFVALQFFTPRDAEHVARRGKFFELRDEDNVKQCSLKRQRSSAGFRVVKSPAVAAAPGAARFARRPLSASQCAATANWLLGPLWGVSGVQHSFAAKLDELLCGTVCASVLLELPASVPAGASRRARGRDLTVTVRGVGFCHLRKAGCKHNVAAARTLPAADAAMVRALIALLTLEAREAREAREAYEAHDAQAAAAAGAGAEARAARSRVATADSLGDALKMALTSAKRAAFAQVELVLRYPAKPLGPADKPAVEVRLKDDSEADILRSIDMASLLEGGQWAATGSHAAPILGQTEVVSRPDDYNANLCDENGAPYAALFAANVDGGGDQDGQDDDDDDDDASLLAVAAAVQAAAADEGEGEQESSF